MKSIPSLKNLIIAHRGIHNNIDIPENSIKAIKESLKVNIPIEIDIQLTKDNQLVVFHDENLKRMTNNDEFVCNKTLDEIKQLNLLDTEETIPTLKEVLNVINNQVLLFIEIKHTKNIKLICETLVNELNNYGNYVLKSFDPRIIRWFKKHKPNITRGLLMMNHKKNIRNIIFNNSIILNYCKPDFISISTNLYKRKKYQKVSTKIPTIIWTIKDYSEINNFQNNSLSFICNNLPIKK